MILMHKLQPQLPFQAGNLDATTEIPLVTGGPGAFFTDVILGRDNFQQLIGMALDILLAPVTEGS